MSRILVGIAAPTCAGKTTVLNELVKRLNPAPTIYSFDEYDLYPPGSQAMRRESTSPTITNWEDPVLFDEKAYIKDLAKIKNGLPIVLKLRSRESIAQSKIKKTITPTAVNIVEGVFLYNDIRAVDLIDLRFFIDIPIEEMVRRRLERSLGGEDPWDKPAYIQNEMINGTVRYVLPQRQHAHFILDGLQPTPVLADIVMSQVQPLLR